MAFFGFGPRGASRRKSIRECVPLYRYPDLLGIRNNNFEQFSGTLIIRRSQFQSEHCLISSDDSFLGKMPSSCKVHALVLYNFGAS